MTESREEVVSLSEETKKKWTSLCSYSSGFLETIDKQYEECFGEKPNNRRRVIEVHSGRGSPGRRSELKSRGFVWNEPSQCWILAEGYDGYTLAWGHYDLNTNAMLLRQDEIPPKGHVHAKWVEVCRRVIREDFERQAKLSKEKISIWKDALREGPAPVWFSVDPAKGKDETAVMHTEQAETLSPSDKVLWVRFPKNYTITKHRPEELLPIHTANSPAVVAQAKPCSSAPALAMHSWPPKGAQRLGLFLPK